MRPLVLIVISTLSFASRAFADEEKKEEPEEKKWMVDLETVIGGGQVDAVNPIVNSSNVTGQLAYERAPTNVIAAGLVLSGRYDFTRELALGARFPVAIASLMPAHDESRTSANLGNIEVELEYEKELGVHAAFFLGAHVALPTSSGDELPTDAQIASNEFNPVAVDQYAINKAVSSAYGDENTALWLAGYLGLIPAAGMKLQFGRLRIEPYVKLESMFSVRSDAHERAVVELVAGGRAAVALIEAREGKVGFDLGVRAWGSFTLTDHEGDLNVGVIEPEVRVGNDRWRVTAGLLISFAGELTDPEWIAGRLSASVLF